MLDGCKIALPAANETIDAVDISQPDDSLSTCTGTTRGVFLEETRCAGLP